MELAPFPLGKLICQLSDVKQNYYANIYIGGTRLDALELQSAIPIKTAVRILACVQKNILQYK